MKKIALPEFPTVPGKFKDEEAFAKNAVRAVEKAVAADDFDEIFLVCPAGFGGGYYVGLQEDCDAHFERAQEAVFLLKPDSTLLSAKCLAEVAEKQGWDIGAYPEEAASVPVSGWLFNSKKELSFFLTQK